MTRALRAAALLAAVLGARAVPPAHAQEPTAAPTPDSYPDAFRVPVIEAPADGEPASDAPDAEPTGDTGYVRPRPEPRLELSGYVDLGWADAQGDGTSFRPGDTRLPADYFVDAFAPMVNSRGDVASTDSGGRFTNGFLPRQVGIGGRPSFLINNLTTDLRYASAGNALTVFARVHLLPRFLPEHGNQTTVWVEQAFARLLPFEAHELALFAGKFDSVFGIEYLDNQSNLRTGVTPSLLARYTTGQSIGAKVFYRRQIAPLWSALSLNVAATNSGNMIEALQPPDASLTGRPVFSARLGYELNLPRVQLKLGGSALRGPRNDQRDADRQQRMEALDARLYLAGFTLAGELVRVAEDAGGRAEKFTGLGPGAFASGFRARGFWVQASYRVLLELGPLSAITPYLRVGQRWARFEGLQPIEVRRLTAGARLDFGPQVALKGEWLKNDELLGAPTVANDVVTTSLVLSY